MKERSWDKNIGFALSAHWRRRRRHYKPNFLRTTTTTLIFDLKNNNDDYNNNNNDDYNNNGSIDNGNNDNEVTVNLPCSTKKMAILLLWKVTVNLPCSTKKMAILLLWKFSTNIIFFNISQKLNFTRTLLFLCVFACVLFLSTFYLFVPVPHW